MDDTAPQTIWLKDYRPPAFDVTDVHLTFRLDAKATRVISRIVFSPREAGADLELFGEGLRLIEGPTIDASRVAHTPLDPDRPPFAKGLRIARADLPEGDFTFACEVEINPAANKALEGLYLSNGMYCTQCEAEGFRRITYYPDRPDVLAPFTVRIEDDAPVLLSNGNLVARGEGWAEWHDPWPKPSYLFALVAGDLVAREDSFTTMSGREVALRLWTRPGPDEAKSAFGMQALKAAMKWDEETYGRAYDLDIFQIVAVSDFNMGAMENKGLNIFNSSAVLASPETSTDANFERIEAIIAHEYFHNWTGNRITCRDWFQLSLKEGLTVFRDQQFSGDMRSKAVRRIEDVMALRGRQFREDNGPLAHPVQPDHFVEINNFYTATIYEKGAEVIGMMKTLVGEEDWARALDLYFTRHDGEAATIDDWVGVFEDTTGRDLGQFKRWYHQAGTPRLSVEEAYDDGTYTLTFRQETPATPGQPAKEPLHIPIATGLLGPNGDEVVPTTILEMTEAEQSFRFEGLAAHPVPSILRGFSAPVILRDDPSHERRAFLLAHDSDAFNRWEAGRALAKDMLVKIVTEGAGPSVNYFEALNHLLRDERLDPAFKALVLNLPGQDDLAQTIFDAGMVPDPTRIYDALEMVKQAMAQHLQDLLPRLSAEMVVDAPYAPDAAQSGKRALGLVLLGLTTRLDGGRAAARAFASADNMTLSFGALSCLVDAGKGAEELEQFHARWQGDALVLDKWFALQVANALPVRAADTARRLSERGDFNWQNPNRFRAVFGALVMNAAGFHDPSGAGYGLLADWLIRLDAVNPQIAARLSSGFETWRRYDADRQQMICAELERIHTTPGLSRDTQEMVSRMLGE